MPGSAACCAVDNGAQTHAPDRGSDEHCGASFVVGSRVHTGKSRPRALFCPAFLRRPLDNRLALAYIVVVGLVVVTGLG